MLADANEEARVEAHERACRWRLGVSDGVEEPLLRAGLQDVRRQPRRELGGGAHDVARGARGVAAPLDVVQVQQQQRVRHRARRVAEEEEARARVQRALGVAHAAPEREHVREGAVQEAAHVLVLVGGLCAAREGDVVWLRRRRGRRRGRAASTNTTTSAVTIDLRSSALSCWTCCCRCCCDGGGGGAPAAATRCPSGSRGCGTSRTCRGALRARWEDTVHYA